MAPYFWVRRSLTAPHIKLLFFIAPSLLYDLQGFFLRG